MTCQQLLTTVGLGLSLGSCAEKTASSFPYPPSVVTAREQLHYKTALWCVYTSYLDSAVFWRPPSDSVWRTLQGLVALPQRLKALDRGPGTTAFRFEVRSPALGRLWGNCRKYGPPPFGFKPLVAVWVNEHDGRVDSVLDIHNVRASPGPVLVRKKGRVTWVWQADARIRLFNADQPFKAAFLRANRNSLPYDLRLLCQEKGIIR